MTRRGVVRVAVVGTVLCLAGVAAGSSGGIIGRSGKQNSTCNSCHQGGKAPKVTLVGPTALDAGDIATYTFLLETDAAITGMNAAVSDGVLSADPDGGATRGESNEVTHARTLRPDAGVAVYSFTMTAPEFGGPITLFAAGNAANNNQQSDGDDSSSTKLTIDVSGPPRPPPPEAGPPPPLPTTTATPPTPKPDAATSGSDSETESGAAPGGDDGGCSIGWGDRSSLPAGAVFGALFGLAALLRVRRR